MSEMQLESGPRGIRHSQRVSVGVRFALWLLRCYKRTLSPLLTRLGVRCRFYPTCSDYAALAIQKYGFLRGSKKAVNRLFRCRPDCEASCIDYP